MDIHIIQHTCESLCLPLPPQLLLLNLYGSPIVMIEIKATETIVRLSVVLHFTDGCC
jgi:hypothetical protein